MLKPLAGLLVAALACAPAFAADDAARLLKFAKANVDKFPGEIQAPGVMTVRGPLDADKLLVQNYDPTTGTLITQDRHLLATAVRFRGICLPAGSYVGQNSYGAKARVQRQVCEVATASDRTMAWFRRDDFALTLNPDEYRAMKHDGLMIEVDIDVGAAVSPGDAVVTRSQRLQKATVDSPTEREITEYSIGGKVLRVRIFDATGKRLLNSFE